MRGCRRSSRLASVDALALLGALALAVGCTPRALDVVDVDSCSDAASDGCSAPPPLDPILRGLVGWWPLDDGPGSGSAQDVSGNDNQGTLSVELDPTMAWVRGRTGTALELGGFGYVLVPHTRSTSIDSIVSAVTMSVWIYFEGSVNPTDMWGTAMSRELGNTNRQHYHISLNINEIPSMYINDTLMTGTTATPRFMWTHLAGTYDGAVARLYVNGALAVTQPMTATFTTDTSPLILGANGNGPVVGITERFPGAIDELMLWNRALSPDEIARLAAGPLPR
jgi:hypothetical protein